VHLVGSVEMRRFADDVIRKNRFLRANSDLFSGDGTASKESGRVHLASKSYFLEHGALLETYAGDAFVTLEDVMVDRKTANYFAYHPVLAVAEDVARIRRTESGAFDIGHHTFKRAHARFLEITGYSKEKLTAEVFAEYLSGDPDAVSRFPLTPPIRAIDLTVVLRLAQLGSRLVAQAA
jgi:hypothetical protein